MPTSFLSSEKTFVNQGCHKRFYRHMFFWIIGTCSSGLYDLPFETSGTASCGTTGTVQNVVTKKRPPSTQAASTHRKLKRIIYTQSICKGLEGLSDSTRSVLHVAVPSSPADCMESCFFPCFTSHLLSPKSYSYTCSRTIRVMNVMNCEPSFAGE